MPSFNDIGMIPEKRWWGPNALFSTDACLTGLAGWSQGEFFKTQIPWCIRKLPNVSINELEALAILSGLKLWGHKVAGVKFLIQCDNNNSVLAINTGKSRNVFMQTLLREMCYILALNDAQMRAIHLPANQNRICDSLSRYHTHQKFRNHFHKSTQGLFTKEVKIQPYLFNLDKIW